LVLDATQPISSEDQELLAKVGTRPAIVVENKTDLRRSSGGSQLEPPSLALRVRTSALTGEGIPELRGTILHQIAGEAGTQGETALLTNARHQSLVNQSLAALTAAVTAVSNRIPHEMLLLDLYNALRPLDEITGATTNDDILNLIFSTFCIGK
jgi:tRNA modification GTPase